MSGMIPAVLQDCKLHSNWVPRDSRVGYSAVMQDEQRAIVAWMRQVMEDHDWSPETWARAAGMAATSITRAMKDDFPYVSKRQTVVKLAEAAGVSPPPVAGFSTTASVSAGNLRPILAMILPLVPKGRVSEQSLRVMSEALAYGLGLLGDHLSTPASEDVLKTVARAAAARFRELGQES